MHIFTIKNQFTIILLFIVASIATTLKAQTVADFEALPLAADTFWNGKDNSGGFFNGPAYFYNNYNAQWGSWSGFSYSNKKDVTTAGHGNQYSAFPGSGYNNSNNYAIANTYSSKAVKLTQEARGKQVDGVYVTNTTYAALSMKNGDSFAKKFGGDSGNDPDWFLLSVSGFFNGLPLEDTVQFYLADYRFEDNTSDYIVSDWEWVDLSGLGKVDSLTFSLSSSDVGSFGMNTPQYFAIDNLTLENLSVASTAVTYSSSVTVSPNPASDVITINTDGLNNYHSLYIADMTGKEYLQIDPGFDQKIIVPVTDLPTGMYVITLVSENRTESKTFIKQ